MNKGARGALIGPIVQQLRALVAGEERLRVYNDHVGEQRQRLWSFFGDEPRRRNNLSSVDILIADSERAEALLILEIEETNASPKTLLGDVFAVAFGGHISAKGGLRYKVTRDTELWVCFEVEAKGYQREKAEALKNPVCEALAHVPNPLQLSFIIADSPQGLVEHVCAAARQWLERKSGAPPRR